MGTYNRERKATTIRQFTTDKDPLWAGGLRVPIGHRIAHAAAALTWCTINMHTRRGCFDFGRLYTMAL